MYLQQIMSLLIRKPGYNRFFFFHFQFHLRRYYCIEFFKSPNHRMWIKDKDIDDLTVNYIDFLMNLYLYENVRIIIKTISSFIRLRNLKI